MSRASVLVALNLLDAGWVPVGFSVTGGDGDEPQTLTLTISTPPITLDPNDPELQRLIARAIGAAPKEH